jgi:hypothetical protein
MQTRVNIAMQNNVMIISTAGWSRSSGCSPTRLNADQAIARSDLLTARLLEQTRPTAAQDDRLA